MLYASDWLAGTADMSHEEKGIFIDMLAQQWLRGSLPNDLNKLCRMFGGDANRNAIASILHKFCISEDGSLHNAKLERVRESSRAALEKRSAANSENAKKRWQKQPLNDQEGQLLPFDEQKENDANRNAIALRSESESISRNESEIEDKKGVENKKSKFDAQGGARSFQVSYRLKQGKPARLEREYAQALTRNFERNQIPYSETAELINFAAMHYMRYHDKKGTATTFIPDPETWLSNDEWLVDWQAATEKVRLEGPKTQKEAEKKALSDYKSPLQKAREEQDALETQKLMDKYKADQLKLQERNGNGLQQQ